MANREEMVLLGGCFWGLERVLSKIKGLHTEVGYSGGDYPYQVTYDNLDSTDHSEALKILWDVDEVSIEDILDAFVAQSRQDPASPGHPRYRRAILCSTPEQTERVTLFLKGNHEGMDVRTGWTWHRAEDYHQKYYDRTLGPDE